VTVTYDNARHEEGRWLGTKFSKRAGLPSATLTLLIEQPLMVTQSRIYKNKIYKERYFEICISLYNSERFDLILLIKLKENLFLLRNVSLEPSNFIFY